MYETIWYWFGFEIMRDQYGNFIIETADTVFTLSEENAKEMAENILKVITLRG